MKSKSKKSSPVGNRRIANATKSSTSKKRRPGNYLSLIVVVAAVGLIGLATWNTIVKPSSASTDFTTDLVQISDQVAFPIARINDPIFLVSETTPKGEQLEDEVSELNSYLSTVADVNVPTEEPTSLDNLIFPDVGSAIEQTIVSIDELEAQIVTTPGSSSNSSFEDDSPVVVEVPIKKTNVLVRWWEGVANWVKGIFDLAYITSPAYAQVTGEAKLRLQLCLGTGSVEDRLRTYEQTSATYAMTRNMNAKVQKLKEEWIKAGADRKEEIMTELGRLKELRSKLKAANAEMIKMCEEAGRQSEDLHQLQLERNQKVAEGGEQIKNILDQDPTLKLRMEREGLYFFINPLTGEIALLRKGWPTPLPVEDLDRLTNNQIAITKEILDQLGVVSDIKSTPEFETAYTTRMQNAPQPAGQGSVMAPSVMRY